MTNSWCHRNIMAMRFDLLETHWEPSRAPRDSKFGTYFRKNPLCSYTEISIASCRNREVIRSGASANSTETDYTCEKFSFIKMSFFNQPFSSSETDHSSESTTASPIILLGKLWWIQKNSVYALYVLYIYSDTKQE